MDQVKDAYRQFLNSSAGRCVEPNSLLSTLVKAKIVTKDEEEIIRNEPTRAKRQNLLFLKILPKKGKKVSKEVSMVVKGMKLMDAQSFKEVYKDHTSIGEFFKLLKQKSKDKSKEKALEKEMAKKSNLDDSSDSLPVPSSPNSPVTPSFDDDEHDFSPFLSVEDDEPFGSPTYSGQDTIRATSEPGARSAQVTARATSVPGANHLAIHDTSPRSMSTEEKIHGVSIDPSELELGPMIGSGGFAKVYNGRYKGKNIAVKMFRDYDQFSLTMFFEEVDIMKKLNHENILDFIGYHNESSKKRLWLLTEYVQGGSMRRFCKRQRDKVGDDVGLTLDQKLYVAACCWNGLDYLHGNKVCHKDISPDNILISDDLSVVKISDFGLAELKQLMTTVVTQISGTPMYYPPEYASETGILRHPIKSDVYSMGASLCEFFSEQWFWNDGDLPKNHFQVLFLLSDQRKAVETNIMPKDPSCWSRIPEPVRKILDHAISADYTKRKSAGELCEMTNALMDELVKEINDE